MNAQRVKRVRILVPCAVAIALYVASCERPSSVAELSAPGSSAATASPVGAPSPNRDEADALPVPATAAASAEEESAGLPRSISGGEDSRDDLARAALDALARRDADALHALRINRAEYEHILWPEFEKTQSERSTLKWDFHWMLLDSKSNAGVRDSLSDFGGQPLELLEVIPTQGIREYDGFRVHRKVELRVRRTTDGHEEQIRAFGSVIEQDGRFKILSFPS